MMISFDLNKIEWQEVAEDGSKYVLLEGHKSQTGNFSFMFFCPSGVWDKPHWHTGDARLYVLSGELRFATNANFDTSLASLYPAGSFLYVPANVIHFDGAEIDTLVRGIASGPWSTHDTISI
jgi:quercetin dioxygenase-like cupin family protein